jgi:hypothetical protein
MSTEQQKLHPYTVEVKVGKVKKAIRLRATSDEDARERALARYTVVSVKRDAENDTAAQGS